MTNMKKILKLIAVFALVVWIDSTNNQPLRAEHTAFYTDADTTQNADTADLSVENCVNYAKEIGVKHPYKTVAQYVLETGWFESKVCKNRNNLGGYKNASGYLKFDTWQACVRYTLNFQDRKGLDSTDNWYAWVESINYHECDPKEYNKLIRSITRTIKKND
jgi:Mannosyl-glycoprotein endo-beta-N-acetylglucosaminidase